MFLYPENGTDLKSMLNYVFMELTANTQCVKDCIVNSQVVFFSHKRLHC